MKNIHVIPTDKPSRYVTNYMEQTMQWQHIYITSDEEIKEGDWFINVHINSNYIDKRAPKASHRYAMNSNAIFSNPKKIILTTDQDLIKDGIQAIDDEFLEWFIKNPSYEVVEVINEQYTQNYHKDIWYNRHKIIIPKEESKQETLEEAAERLWLDSTSQLTSKNSFIEGAKWQQERMYSEEDMSKAYFQGWATRERYDDMVPDIIYPKDLDYEEQQDYAFNLWFEQFKKK